MKFYIINVLCAVFAMGTTSCSSFYANQKFSEMTNNSVDCKINQEELLAEIKNDFYNNYSLYNSYPDKIYIKNLYSKEDLKIYLIPDLYIRNNTKKFYCGDDFSSFIDKKSCSYEEPIVLVFYQKKFITSFIYNKVMANKTLHLDKRLDNRHILAKLIQKKPTGVYNLYFPNKSNNF